MSITFQKVNGITAAYKCTSHTFIWTSTKKNSMFLRSFRTSACNGEGCRSYSWWINNERRSKSSFQVFIENQLCKLLQLRLPNSQWGRGHLYRTSDGVTMGLAVGRREDSPYLSNKQNWNMFLLVLPLMEYSSSNPKRTVCAYCVTVFVCLIKRLYLISALNKTLHNQIWIHNN